MFHTGLHLAQMNNKEISKYLSLRLEFQGTSTSSANIFEEAKWCHVKGGGKWGRGVSGFRGYFPEGGGNKTNMRQIEQI